MADLVPKPPSYFSRLSDNTVANLAAAAIISVAGRIVSEIFSTPFPLWLAVLIFAIASGVLLGLRRYRHHREPAGWYETPENDLLPTVLDAPVDDEIKRHKINTLRDFIHEGHALNAQGYQPIRIISNPESLFGNRVERFLQDYFSDVHIHRYKDKGVVALEGFLKEILADSKPQQLSTALPEGHEIVRLSPNIEPLSPVEYEGHYEKFAVIVRGPAKDVSDRRLVVAIPYHNVRSRGVPNIGIAQGVKARLAFRFFTARPNFTVHSGTWVSETNNKVDFGVDDKHDLVLVIAHTNDATGARYALEREVSGYYPGGQSIRHELAAGDEMVVGITLLASDGSSISTGIDEYMVELRPLGQYPIARVMPLLAWRTRRLMEWQMRGYELMKEHSEADEGAAAEALVSQIRDWEAQCGEGLGKYFSGSSKEQFLTLRPSIDEGLAEVPRTVILPAISSNPDEFTSHSTQWALYDGVFVRIKHLKSLM